MTVPDRKMHSFSQNIVMLILHFTDSMQLAETKQKEKIMVYTSGFVSPFVLWKCDLADR